MTEKQFIHISMTNSFNLLMGNVSFKELEKSHIPMLAHNPFYEIDIDELEDIMEYFESIEMYENCAKLKKRYQSFFIDNNNNQTCTCDLPVIKRYTSVVRCDVCKKKLIK